MSKYISDNIKKKYSISQKPFLNLMIKLSPLLMKKNILLQKILLKSQNKTEKINIKNSNIFTDINLESCSKHFFENGYVFIENILEKNFHAALIKNWPKKFFFRPKHQIEKSYDTGFKYFRHWDKTPNLNYFIYLNQLYLSLQSKKFYENISKLSIDNYNLSCYSITSSIAYGGSALFPHIDDIAITHRGKIEATSRLNCIFFIYANPNDSHSGGTSIYSDNEFKSLIFKPNNLVNSLLIYKTDKNIYHGFHEMPKNSLRYAVTAQFDKKID